MSHCFKVLLNASIPFSCNFYYFNSASYRTVSLTLRRDCFLFAAGYVTKTKATEGCVLPHPSDQNSGSQLPSGNTDIYIIIQNRKIKVTK